MGMDRQSLDTITIVGAGPSGLLLAHYLLARGYAVEVYDRRPDPRLMSPDTRRSFPVVLHERGRRALQAIPGLEAAIAMHGNLCSGSVLHSKKGFRDVPRAQTSIVVGRNQLVAILLEQLDARYESSRPGSPLKIQFDCQCQSLNCEQQTIAFRRSSGETFSVTYERLIGADGVGSQIRTELVNRYGLKSQKEEIPDAYRSMFCRRVNVEQGVELAADRIHTANRGMDCRILMGAQPGDHLYGVLIFDANHDPLVGMDSPGDVLEFVGEHFPTFRALMDDDDAEDLLGRPVVRLMSVSCDRFHQGDRVLLIGDAAHAVSPSIGQGCNSALEDAAILNRLLDQYGDDWSQVMPMFSQIRVPDAHALQELSNYSFPRTKGLMVELLLRLTLGRRLHKWFPSLVLPFVSDLLMDSSRSYTEVLQLSQGWIDKVKRSTATP